MSYTIVLDVVMALGLTALLAEAYGLVRRKCAGRAFAPSVLGVLFGLMALVQMNIPIEPFDGVIIDFRNIPIALAGAFLGWRGLLPCLALAMGMRVGLGGVGLESGLWAMVIAGVAGLAWARKSVHIDARRFGSFLALGLAMSSHLFAALLLPREIAVWFITTAAAPMLIINMVAVPLLAALLERENRHIRKENRLSASATHDPVSGLLLGPAFLREMTNAYTARALGTFAGFLTITPERSILRSAIDLFAEPAPSPLDRQALAEYLEHANLAGLCADGRILVPLSSAEVQHFSRVKANLNLALRNTPSAASGAVVSVSLREIPDPVEFLRYTETAHVSAVVDWGGEISARKPRKNEEPTTTMPRSDIYDHKKHALLFAKADFLIERKRRFAP